VIEALYPDALQVKTTYLDVQGESTSLRSKSATSAILGLSDDWHYVPVIFSGMDTHGLLVGQSGGGKTTTLRTILGQLARSDTAQFAIIDGKGGGPESLDDIATLRGLVGPIAHSIEEAQAVIEYVTRELNRRNNAEACINPFYLVVDEFHFYTPVPEISRWFDDFGRRARSKNMHLILGTQRTDAKVWGVAGQTLQGQFGSVVLHRMMNYNDVKTVTGYSYPPAHTLAGAGDVYFQSVRSGTQRIQVALLTELDYKKVLGNEPGAAWQTHPDTDGRFTCRQKMAAVYVASIYAANHKRGGRGTLQDVLTGINEPEKSNTTADDLLALGRNTYFEFKESYGKESESDAE
jgi:energy-coupling factor transporter ATP-binding protein EcfA2